MCDTDKLEKTYRVKDYKYVGGALGKCNERVMMEEIKENGPVVVNFEPDTAFMYYGGGVYHSVDAADWILNGEPAPEWQKVDHAVLAYGIFLILKKYF